MANDKPWQTTIWMCPESRRIVYFKNGAWHGENMSFADRVGYQHSRTSGAVLLTNLTHNPAGMPDRWIPDGIAPSVRLAASLLSKSIVACFFQKICCMGRTNSWWLIGFLLLTVHDPVLLFEVDLSTS